MKHLPSFREWCGWFLTPLFLFIALLFSSCRTLSPTQISQINKFAASCDSFSRYPSTLFSELAELRLERGVYFTSTLTDSEARVEELNALSKGYDQELLVAKKCDVAMGVIKSYSAALKSMAAPARWEERGRELRTTGSAFDSLAIEINRLQLLTDLIPIGVAKSSATLLAYGEEYRVRARQFKIVKSFIEEADSLVSAICDGMVELLRAPSVDFLIESEKSALPISYQNYLSIAGGGRESDREFIRLLKRSQQLAHMRGYITSAFGRLAKGHHQLVVDIEKRRDFEQLYDSLLAFGEAVEQIEREYKRVEKLLK